MSRSYRFAIIALGLTLFASLGQAEEKAKPEDRETTQQERPSQTLPIPLPVHIVEDHAAADARERREEEARQREIEDVAAQVSMDASTRAMNDATQDMREYSFYSTLLVGIGTVLLFVTLFLTWQANRAAQDAVTVTREIGEAQIRAFLFVGGEQITSDYHSVIPEIEIMVFNHGQTPGVLKKLHYEWAYEEPIIDPPIYIPDGTMIQSNVVGGGQSHLFATTNLHPSRPYFYGFIEYEDVFRKTRTSRFCMRMTIVSQSKIISEPAGPIAYNEWD